MIPDLQEDIRKMLQKIPRPQKKIILSFYYFPMYFFWYITSDKKSA
jgi:hypothetical protein